MPYVAVGRRRVKAAIDYEAHPVFGKRSFWRQELHRIIFGHATPGGKLFDIILIVSIILSVSVVMLESVQSVRADWGPFLRTWEWIFTIGFSIEYLVRLIAAEKARRYSRTFFGIIDLLAIVPTYLSFIFPGAQAGSVLRILRVLRVFRVLKLAQFIGGERMLIRAIRSSAYKIVVFLIAVLTAVIVFGSAMYYIEGADSGFTSIPRSVYWAIVTLTTVGFGDITPLTPLGQMLAAMIMVLGYGVIAVPTGIVTAGMLGKVRVEGTAPARSPSRTCSTCERAGHTSDAQYCCYCGMELPG